VTHNPYLQKIRCRSVILVDNNIIVFGENLPLPFLEGMERFWDRSQYSNYATGWMIQGSNPDRGKRFSLPKCPDQLWDPPSLPQLPIQ
jgi:hypothetical protein